MPLALIIIAIFVLFGAYAVAPMFGLDELYPQYFHDDALAWQGGIVALVLVGGVIWWRGRQLEDEQD